MLDCEEQFPIKKRSLSWSPSPFTALTGKQLYRCRACGRQSRENTTPNAYPEARREEILHAYQERSSLRGLTRTDCASPAQRYQVGSKKRSSASSLQYDLGHSRSAGCYFHHIGTRRALVICAQKSESLLGLDRPLP